MNGYDDWGTQDFVDEIEKLKRRVVLLEKQIRDMGSIPDQEARLRERAPRTRDGYVYIIFGNGLYKIGLTKNPNDRLHMFSIKMPFPISVVYLIESEDAVALERTLHRRYKKRRVNGEWFALTPADLVEINKDYVRANHDEDMHGDLDMSEQFVRNAQKAARRTFKQRGNE